MAKYIDVESLVIGYSGHTPDDEFSKGVDFALDLLDSKPPEDVRPVVRGKWKVTSIYIKCLECGECFMLIPQNFCPNCGADMRGENDG